MKLKGFKVLVFVFSFGILQAQEFITYDHYLSPYSGANNFQMIQKSLLRLENELLPPNSEDKNGYDWERLMLTYEAPDQMHITNKTFFRAWLRLAELIAVWKPINHMTLLFQHEIFGHGFRAREFGYKNIRYHFYPEITKKGFGGGASTEYSPDSIPTLTEELAIDIAGMEASSILARNLLINSIEKGFLDGRQASLWRLTHYDASRYIATLKKCPEERIDYLEDFSHDVVSYLQYFEYFYSDPQEKYSSTPKHFKDLRSKVVAALILNPFHYISYLSELTYFLFNAPFKIEGLPLGKGFQCIPAYSFAMTPFGTQDILENYIWLKGKAPTYMAFRFPSTENSCNTSFTIENRSIFKSKWGHLGLKIDAWKQPKLHSIPLTTLARICIAVYENQPGARERYQSLNLKKTFFGGALSAIYTLPLPKTGEGIANIQVGYKTKGYLPGETLKQGWFFRGGLSIPF